MTDSASGAESTLQLTAREQELLMAALRSLKSGPIEVDYAKFQIETGLATQGSARSSWAVLKKKLFGDTRIVAAAALDGKLAKSKAARQPAEPKTPKTPKSTTKTTVKSDAKVKDDTDGNDDDVPKIETPATGGIAPAEVKSQANDTISADADGKPTAYTGDKDEEGDSHMFDIVESIEGTDTEMKDEGKERVTISKEAASPKLITTGEMSPPPTPTPTAAKGPKTPSKLRAKPTPATKDPSKQYDTAPPTTPASNATSGAADDSPVQVTPSTGTPSLATPKKRKTKVEKDSEAADGGDEEKPAKKPCKTPVKKVKKEDAKMEEGGESDIETTITAAVEGGTPKTEEKVKKPRNPAAKKGSATLKEPTAAQKLKAEKATESAKKKADREQKAADAAETKAAKAKKVAETAAAKAATAKAKANKQAAKDTAREDAERVTAEAKADAVRIAAENQTEVERAAAEKKAEAEADKTKANDGLANQLPLKKINVETKTKEENEDEDETEVKTEVKPGVKTKGRSKTSQTMTKSSGSGTPVIEVETPHKDKFRSKTLSKSPGLANPSLPSWGTPVNAAPPVSTPDSNNLATVDRNPKPSVLKDAILSAAQSEEDAEDTITVAPASPQE